MATSFSTDFKKATTWSIVLSVLMIAAGVLAILYPGAGGIAVTAVVAWLLVFSGFLHLAYAWRVSGAKAVIGELLLAVLYAGIGFYMLARPAVGLESLTLAIALYLLIEGILEFTLSFRLRPAPGSGWLLFDGIVTLILSAMIWATWPSNTPWVVGTLIGISMIFSGTTRLMLSTAARQVVA